MIDITEIRFQKL